MSEHNHRSIAKAVSWRILATLATMTIVYVFTGDLSISAGVGGIEIIVKLVLNYYHERFWVRIKWGYIDDK